jgi:two-component system response regulator YesN
VRFDVEMFYDPRSALLRARESVPDVLVSDITMPGINGVELAHALRRQNPGCKIILMSGNPEWKTSLELRPDMLDGFIMLLKPFSREELLRCIVAELT